MIARVWTGRTRARDRARYLEYLGQTGVPDCRTTPGNRGVLVLHRDQGETTEFVFISLWDSLDVIRGFAGEDIDAARYYPEDPAFLLELAPRVAHYEVES